MQQPAYLVTDAAGRVLTWRHNIHQAIREAKKRHQDHEHVLITRGGTVLAVVYNRNYEEILAGGADAVLRAIDRKFAAYERYNDRRLAENPVRVRERVPGKHGICHCGDKAWDLLPAEATARCRSCRAYALLKPGSCVFHKPRAYPLYCVVCKAPATRRTKRNTCDYRFDYLCDEHEAPQKKAHGPSEFPSGAKTCPACTRELPWPDSFHKNKSSTSGRDATCRDCRKQQRDFRKGRNASKREAA